MDKQDELVAVIVEAFHLQEGPNMVLDLSGPQWPSSGLGLDGAFDISAIAAAVRSFMGSDEVVERAARASFAFRHQGDIADPERTWDAPDKSEHPLYWQQKMEHNHPHYRAMARAALSAAIGEDIGGGRG